MTAVLDAAPNAPTLCWSTGRTRTTATWAPVNDQSWSAFVRWLKPDQPAASKEMHPYVGGTLQHGRRTIRTVDQRFFLTLDADYAEPEFPLDVALLLTDTPYLIHTTWRHSPEAHRYRLIIPLDRGVTPNEYKALSWLVMNRLGGEQFDRTTAQAERFMWGPSTQAPTEYWFESAHAGAAYLPADAWLDSQHSPSDVQPAGKGANTPPPVPATGSGAHSVSPATDEDRERAEEILQSAVDGVTELHERGEFSGRNEAVFHLLPTLLRFCEAGALDEDLVLDSLYDASQLVEADEPYTREEFNASVQSARQYADEEGPALPETTRTRLAIADFEDVEDDDFEDENEDLWGATPQLRHIAQAADNIACSRSAMLSATLLRILVQVDPSIQLAGSRDGSVSSRAALNLGVVFVGASGQGKSTVADASSELLPGSERFRNSKMSTGQGLIQTYLQWDEAAQENRLVAEPNALFWFDEIDALAATSSDTSNTVLSEVRTMMTGGQTGTQTATAIRRRNLPARSYNFQLAINAQPSRTGVLLNDRDGGTPQRFIWAPVIDKQDLVHPDDRPVWPGPLDWNPDFLLDFEFGIREFVDIPEWLKKELKDYDWKMRQEGMEGGPLSRNSHKNLLRLKVAVGIAFLHGSSVVTDEHIEIADHVVKDSYQIQRKCEGIIAKTEFSAKLAKIESDNRVLDVSSDKKLQALVETALKKLRASDGWVYWRDLRPAYRDREKWGDLVWEELSNHPNITTTEENKSRKARISETD